jgi:peptidoglycan/LPS O-acetylase OafA/YrhL
MGLVRVTLAMAVLLSHLPILDFKIVSGALAVQSFFIVSGFYMAMVLDGKYKDAGLFYSNRLLRLFPTYFLCCALAALTVWVLKASPTASPEIFATIFSDPLTAAIMVFENIFMVGQELLFWFTINPDGSLALDPIGDMQDETTVLGWQGLLVPQSWSLSMELMFYALAPWLARAGWKWIALIAAISLGLRLSGAFLPIDYLLWQGRFFPTALFLFLFGMLAYKALPFAARLPRVAGWIVNALLLAFLITHPMLQDALNVEPVRGRWLVYVVVAAAIPFVFVTFRDFAWDRWIGDLSYPIYLSQLMTVGLVLTYEPPYPAAVAIIGTLALSALILVLVEHPLDRWRQQRINKAPPEASAAPDGVSVGPL